MRYFYIFILTLILISCNEKKGYSDVSVMYGKLELVFDETECRKVIEKGKILSTIVEGETLGLIPETRVLYKGYIYRIGIGMKGHICFDKRKFHDK